jgi:hypothetical protein
MSVSLSREEEFRHTFFGEIPLWNEFLVRSARDMDVWVEKLLIR